MGCASSEGSLVRQHGCVGSTEPPLFAFGISTDIVCSIGIALIYTVTHMRNKNSNIQGEATECGKSDFPCHKELLI